MITEIKTKLDVWIEKKKRNPIVISMYDIIGFFLLPCTFFFLMDQLGIHEFRFNDYAFNLIFYGLSVIICGNADRNRYQKELMKAYGSG